MSRVLYLPEALEDLHQIWRQIWERTRSAEVADHVLELIDDAAIRYAQQPEMGLRRPELAERIRCFTAGSYVVFYLPRAEGIEVLQVIHGARDAPAHFRRPH